MKLIPSAMRALYFEMATWSKPYLTLLPVPIYGEVMG